MIFPGFGEGKRLEAGRYYWNGKEWIRSEPVVPKEGLTIIPDEPEFVSRDAFPETVKWTGRRSKKAIMRRYNCVDFRDIKGVGREKEKRKRELYAKYKNDPMINTEVRSVSKDEVQKRREQRKRTHFTGYRLVG